MTDAEQDAALSRSARLGELSCEFLALGLQDEAKQCWRLSQVAAKPLVDYLEALYQESTNA